MIDPTLSVGQQLENQRQFLLNQLSPSKQKANIVAQSLTSQTTQFL